MDKGKLSVRIYSLSYVPKKVQEKCFIPENDIWGNVIAVYHGDEVVYAETDIMEPEDATFRRNLGWISHAIMMAYEAGIKDGKSLS